MIMQKLVYYSIQIWRFTRISFSRPIETIGPPEILQTKVSDYFIFSVEHAQQRNLDVHATKKGWQILAYEQMQL